MTADTDTIRMTLDAYAEDVNWFRDLCRIQDTKQRVAFSELRRLWELNNIRAPKGKKRRVRKS